LFIFCAKTFSKKIEVFLVVVLVNHEYRIQFVSCLLKAIVSKFGVFFKYILLKNLFSNKIFVSLSQEKLLKKKNVYAIFDNKEKKTVKNQTTNDT
jgi:hypothetical protein